MDELEILIHDEVQLLDWGESRSTGPWVKLRLKSPEQLDRFRGMDTATATKTGHILNLTLSIGDILDETPESNVVEMDAKYGQQAKILRQSSFFRTPEVWAAVGSDEDFLAWVRTQSCAYCNATGPSEAAHVRRISSGAGTGIKPTYAAIPLCHKHHAAQHHAGESALGGKDWFDKKRIEYVQQWCWEVLKAQFGYYSWKFIPPHELHEWAIDNGVEEYVPDFYVDS